MKIPIRMVVMALILLSGSAAGAHSLWLNTDHNQCDVGKAIVLQLGWGHNFPVTGEIKAGMVNEIFAVAPDGKRIPLKQLSKTTFRLVPDQEGTYVISGNVHPGFVSKTTQGYKMGPKKDFEQVISCFHYDLRTKTFLRVGRAAQTQIPEVKDPLEIIPMKSPIGLKQGTDFPIKVLFNGGPLANAMIKATYEGFSDTPHTFALTVQTDSEGVAKVALMKKGEWFLSVTHEIPYKDKKTCDIQKYNATMTFNVK